MHMSSQHDLVSAAEMCCATELQATWQPIYIETCFQGTIVVPSRRAFLFDIGMNSFAMVPSAIVQNERNCHRETSNFVGTPFLEPRNRGHDRQLRDRVQYTSHQWRRHGR